MAQDAAPIAVALFERYNELAMPDRRLHESEAVEVHEMLHIDGMMKIREVPEVRIPAHGQLRLEPGGKHLMLMGPRQKLVSGQSIDVTLRSASGREQTISLGVVDR